MPQIRAIAHGKVQGVWYRASTVERARDLGLRGYARNLADGTVEVVAAGTDAALRQLVDWLHEGPELARVEKVNADWTDTTPIGERFDVRY